jgi:hypothetical protein
MRSASSPVFLAHSHVGRVSPRKLRRRLWQVFVSDVVPPPKWTPLQYAQHALARAPDPLWFSADLYSVNVYGSGGIASSVHQGGFTVFINFPLLIGMATVLGMLCVGADTDAIRSELLMQLKAHSLAGPVPVGLRALLDDYTIMSQYERAGKKWPGWSAIHNPLVHTTVEPTRPAPAQSAPSAKAKAAATIRHFLGLYLR